MQLLCYNVSRGLKCTSLKIILIAALYAISICKYKRQKVKHLQKQKFIAEICHLDFYVVE